MKQLFRRSILSAFLLFALALITNVDQATAQIDTNNCCEFQLHAVTGIPDACIPIQVTTTWNGVSQTDVISTKGPSGTQTITIPGCTPPATLNSISINGGPAITSVDQGGYSDSFMLCGVCVKVRVVENANGCLAIGIMLCSQS